MANLPESATFDAGVYQLELTDPVVGGPPNPATGAGKSNIPALQLANRTRWLKDQIDAILDGSAEGVTSAQFDADQSFATCEFVQRALGNYRAAVQHTTAAAFILTAAHVGVLLHLAGTAGLAQAVTLPDGLALGLPTGAAYTVARISPTGSAVVTAAAGQTIDTGNGVSGSVTLMGGDTASFVWGGTGWLMAGPALQRVAGMTFSFGASGWQRLPSGMILQWGTTTTIAQGGNALVTFPVTFPSAIFSAYATPISTVDNTNSYSVATRAETLSNMRVTNNSGSSGVVAARWLAFGN